MKLSNKAYNFLKWFLILFIPALNSLIITLGIIYKKDVEILVLTINAFAAFLGTITGISNKNYNKEISEKKVGK